MIFTVSWRDVRRITLHTHRFHLYPCHRHHFTHMFCWYPGIVVGSAEGNGTYVHPSLCCRNLFSLRKKHRPMKGKSIPTTDIPFLNCAMIASVHLYHTISIISDHTYHMIIYHSITSHIVHRIPYIILYTMPIQNNSTCYIYYDQLQGHRDWYQVTIYDCWGELELARRNKVAGACKLHV